MAKRKTAKLDSCFSQSKNSYIVLVAERRKRKSRIEKTGVSAQKLDSRFRGNDKNPYPQQILYKSFWELLSFPVIQLA